MSIRKNKTFTVTFAAIDSTSRPDRKTGLVFASGDAKISKDGGSFTNTSNTPSEISAGRYKLDLTAAELSADTFHLYVTKTGMDDVDVVYATGGQPDGSIVADGGNTALTFKTNRTEATDDYWKDALILFTSGSLAGQVKKVSAYTGSTKFVTVSAAFTAAPSASDRFVLVNL